MSKKHEPGMAYDMKILNKVFFFLSLALLLSTFWMFLDDYVRPWKKVQMGAMEVKRNLLKEQIKTQTEGIDKAKHAELLKNLEDGKKAVSSRKAEIKEVTKELNVLSGKTKAETIINGTLNSKVSALTFDWGVAHSHHYKTEGSLFAKLQKMKNLFAESKDRMKFLSAKEKKLTKTINVLNKEVINANKDIKELTGTLELLKAAKSKTEITPLFALRNAPLGDFLDPTLRIKQVVMTNITDDRYFQHVAKVDRCMTCHTFIDKKGFEDQPNPYKTHPKMDLMVGLNSPHPMKGFGCTTCHGGEGQRVVDFNSAAHTPRDEKQKKQWEDDYNWHAPHKVPQIMYKVGQTEAGCVKCHQGEEFVPQAHVLNEGRQNIEKFGCYGCHKIKGWEHKRKPGPSLERIASKVSKEFFKNWVWDPKSFNKHAKMPSFFSQDNNSKKEFMVKNIAEVNAMAEFIYEKSQKYKPFAKYTGGNKARGKTLIKDIGCMGCHGSEGFPQESKKIDAYAGPFLDGTGSKVRNPDWMVSWLKKPSHYSPDTIMPSFRLTDREANDITAYLMSLRNKTFERLKFEPLDKTVRDEILVTYFSAFDTKELAKKKLANMSDHARTMELGSRSVGKYGCYSCHNIEGFDGRAPIGPELTNVGSKPITQFGFSHEKVEHSRDGWIKAHLINPRRWDNGVDKPFKDLLRMPNLHMTEKEAESITVALVGQVSDYVPLSGIKRFDSNEAIVAEGMKVANKYNCIGCHKIDGFRGDILKIYEDDINEGPPMLVNEGHRVQSDWFHHFLSNVYPIRPWLKVRMPSFNLSNDEKNKLVALFQAKANQGTFEDLGKGVAWQPGEKSAAKLLFNRLECASCHTAGFNSEDATAPNLFQAKRRLRGSWIKKWLKNPQAILSDTVMPNFWEDGESQEPGILGGDPDKQIDALTKYILEMGYDKLPKSKF